MSVGKPHLRLQLCRALRGGAALERGRSSSSSSSRRCGRSIVRRCFEAAGLSFLGVLCPKSMKDETCHSYNSSLIDLRSQRNQHRERLAQSSGKPSSMFSFIKVHSASVLGTMDLHAKCEHGLGCKLCPFVQRPFPSSSSVSKDVTTCRCSHPPPVNPNFILCPYNTFNTAAHMFTCLHYTDQYIAYMYIYSIYTYNHFIARTSKRPISAERA